MQVSVVDNTAQNLLPVLREAVESANDLRVATACLSLRGFTLIESAVRALLAASGTVEFLVGLDLSGTDPAALWQLHQLHSQHGSRASWYCYRGLAPGVIYHPKVYLAQAPAALTAIVGSSNLTEGGLRRNIEVNVVLWAHPDEEVASDLWASYNELKFKQPRICPDEEFLQLFQNLHGEAGRASSAVKQRKEVRELRKALQEKAATLARPQPSMGDLHGWQRLVYEQLPAGDFRTSDLYVWEGLFQERYPDNMNVRAKIRQVLQQLRDMGLLEHRERGEWFRPRP